MINCVLVDDNDSSIQELIEYISNIPELNILRVFTNPIEALTYLTEFESKVDILFADIEMPLLSGIELAMLVRAKINQLIFTTSHAKFALAAFEVSANAYLLKPYNLAKLIMVLKPLYPLFFESPKHIRRNADYVFVKSKDDDFKILKVYFQDIIAIESMLNYVRIHTINQKIITRISLKEVKETLLQRKEFLHLHRSFIISEYHISVICGNTITMTSGTKFTIGDRYKDILITFLEGRFLKSV